MSGKEQNATRRCGRRTENALLAFGLILLAFWGAARVHGIFSSRAALQRLGAHDPASSTPANSIRGDRGKDPSFGVDFSLWDEERIRAHNTSLTKDLDTPVAVLRIPKISLEVPVFDRTDSLTLNRAIGRIPGTARLGEQGNIGLAGHRDGFFRALKNVRVGDTMELKSSNGTALYVVDQISIVDPKDVSVLKSRLSPSLTLVTCYPFYFVGSAPQRYIVSASLAQEDDRNAGQAVVPINKAGQLEKEKQ
jgi:sortase A